MKQLRLKQRRMLGTKVLLVSGVAIVCAVSIFIYARNQQLLREDERRFRAMQSEVDAVRDEVSQKTGLPAKKVAYCSHRSEKYKEGPLFCSYGYSFGEETTKDRSLDFVNQMKSIASVGSLIQDSGCLVTDSSFSTGHLVYAPHLYCQPDTRKAYFPMREE